MISLNYDGHTDSHNGREHAKALEAYANAVRMYQDVVLELQESVSLDPASLGSVLERAAAAKAMVNRYRSAHRQAI